MTRQVPFDQLSVRYVKGVGPARAEQLKRLGIHTVEELLFCVPRRHEDRSNLVPIRALVPGQVATVRGQVLAKSLRRTKRGQVIVEAALGDPTGILYCLWFHQPYLHQQLRVGDELILYGRVEPGLPASHRSAQAGSRLQLIHPEIEQVDGASSDATLHMGRIVPIYPLTEGVNQRWFRRVVHEALNRYADPIREALPSSMRARHHLQPASWAIQQMHFPESWEALAEAHRRLAFEEFLIMQLRLALRRARMVAQRKPRCYQPDGPLIQDFLRRLPFVLTVSQREVLKELVDDLCQPSPMLRLLQGDVGCGKTIVAACLMAVVVQSGSQGALMAPTELLAEQHYRVLRQYFEPLGVRVELLSHGVRMLERHRLLQRIAQGTTQLVVGTHALIEHPVTFANLGLVIIDEQHKFGVIQRRALARKAQVPDVLVMTATPIPRTLALSVYGDLACSTITGCPSGRLPIRTRLLQESQRQDAYQLIRKELQQGRQGYVVYPLVETSERLVLKAATKMAHVLQTQVFPEAQVELLHGQMPSKQKEAIMHAFVEGRIQLLVSTVIVEVGLDVPNATIMLIEHAERFGLAQLHQLRGRIGRGPHPSTCLALSDTSDETARQRLLAFADTTDGFRLAETDLTLRGPGELLGRRQSGLLQFRVADLIQDRALLDTARQEALALIERDPQLTHPDLAPLAQQVRGSRLRAS